MARMPEGVHTMTDAVALEFARFIREERQAKRLPTSRAQIAEGEIGDAVFVASEHAAALLRVAARRAAGFFRPTRRTEVVWVQGESELAVKMAEVDVRVAEGLIIVLIPVRCDQTGDATIEVAFAVGSPKEPAGLYASTYRRPSGPPIIVGAWSEAPSSRPQSRSSRSVTERWPAPARGGTT